MLELTRAIATRLGLGEPQPWPAAEASRAWGHEMSAFALGSNSRMRDQAAAKSLGWVPKHGSAIDWILREFKVQRSGGVSD